MNGSATSRFVRVSIALLGLVTLGCVLAGNAAKPAPHRVSLPTDWSHSHLIFSHGRDASRSQRMQEDPRYWQQIQRQIPRRIAPMQISLNGASALGAAPKGRRSRVHRDWSEDLGVGGSVGAGNFPAKFSFDATTANCLNDYVVFSTGKFGSVTQATLVAFNNLYSSCGPTVPSVLFAYDTSQILPADATAIRTSPALSLDGSQIAFVQTDGGAAQLVLLKWSANSGESVTAPGTPLQVPPSNYRTCPLAPCSTKFNLTNLSGVPQNDETSSVFIDYSGDVAWVGDNGGSLHKFTGVFNGTPAEVRDGTWPVQVSGSGKPLSSPVFDHVTGSVLVGGGAGDGKLYRVVASSGAVTASNQLDFSLGIGAGPVVDSGNGTVYVAVGNDGTGLCLNPDAVDCSGVFQFSTNFATGTPGNEDVVGVSTDHALGAPKAMYNGYFDSSYLNSVDGTGNYYVCGNTGGAPILYQVPIAAGLLGTPVMVAQLAPPVSNPACSPVTDILNPNGSNGTAEKAFVSVDNSGQVCTNPTGCIMSFVTTPWQANTDYNVGQQILERSLGNPDVLFIQICIASGTSGGTQPAWGFAPDLVTSDNTVGWLNQGRIDDVPFASWTANTPFNTIGQRILASNGRLQLVDAAGTSGGSEPTWTTMGLNNQTTDGTMTWRDAGPPPATAVPVAGGTSGIIIDNTVGSGPITGTSQIYFTTLDDQACPTSGGTGGCAIQMSQSSLQ